MAKKTFPSDLTSYDLLKTFAVVTMIIDHIGFYFFPDIMWWRVVGRMSFPVWLFLIGYARSRDISLRLIIGAVVLLGASMILGPAVLPLSILVTIIVVRLVLPYVVAFALTSRTHMMLFCCVFFLLAFVTNGFVEYGTLAFIVAFMGYIFRHREDARINKNLREYFTFFTAFSVVVIQAILFGFNQTEVMVMALLVAPVIFMLGYFKPAVFSGLTETLPPLICGALKIGGRRTLEIYVVHVVLFKVLALLLGVKGFELFEMHLFIPQS